MKMVAFHQIFGRIPTNSSAINDVQIKSHMDPSYNPFPYVWLKLKKKKGTVDSFINILRMLGKFSYEIKYWVQIKINTLYDLESLINKTHQATKRSNNY
jgi:hypothetical protein